jgi:microcystin-dependent protein
MGVPFLGELRVFSFNFPPRGWAFANGQLLPINQNQALFSLLGTTYGGNGQTNFALPDLRGSVPIHVGQGFNQGPAIGEISHTLTTGELPTHQHFVQATSATTTGTPVPTNNVLGQGLNVYGPATQLTALASDSITNYGGSQAHENMMPYLVLNIGIALQGAFPSRD